MISNTSWAASPILYGIVSGNRSTEILKNLRENEISAIQTTLKKQVEFKLFTTFQDILSTAQQDPNHLTFLYVKEPYVSAVKAMKNWVQLAQVLSVDPKTHQLSNTYTAYLISSKNSKIKKLLDDNKISNIQWVKSKTLDDAQNMVMKGEADAVGTWDYYFLSHRYRDQFKILSTIKHLANAYLYVNANNVNTKQQAAIKRALKKYAQEKHAAFTYK